MVSIHGPLGYGPSTLPLRHSAIGVHQSNPTEYAVPVVKLSLYFMLSEVKLSAKVMSEVGFEPTPTEVDCDLNAAP